jgi:hypothetical protein
MTDKAITLKFVVPTALAIALGIMISIGTFLFAEKSAVPLGRLDANQSDTNSRGIAAWPNPEVQLSRVRLVLFNMK